MKRNILKEIEEIKYLFNYDRGRIISEQELFNGEKIDLDEFELNVDDDLTAMDEEIYEEEDLDVPVMLPGTKEKERIKIDPGTKPKQPKTPYKPKPGPKPDPKAGRKGEMPDWLTFDELGIEFE
jgi:hypothetical protein